MSNHPLARRSRTVRTRIAAIATGVAVVLAGLGTATAASADESTPTTYYVNCSAKKQGTGTAKSPWRTLAKIHDHGAFVPGDKILLKRGTVCRGQVRAIGSGAKGKPIILGATGKGAKPRIVGGGTKNETGAVELRDVSWWTVQDLDVSNWTGGRNPKTYRSGILVWNSGIGRLAGITIQRNSVHSVSSNPAGHGRPRDFGGISVITAGAHGDGYDKVRIAHNTVKEVGRTGIMVSNREYPGSADTGVLVDHNRVSKSRGDGIVLLGSHGGRLAYNTVSGAADFWPCPQCGGISPATANAGIWTAASVDVRIDHNEAYGTKMLGGDGEGIDVDASAVNTVVEYNYSHDNEGGGILFCGSKGAIARFNILENNAKSAFAFIGSVPAKNTSIYNNTVYNSGSIRARVVRYFNGAHGSGISFKNNLVYNYSVADYLWPVKKVSMAGNTVVGLRGKGGPTGSTTSSVNPGLKNPGTGKVGIKTLGGYKPKHPSSFKKGVAITKTVTRDFFGKKINPAKPPRGAAG
jgi:parallel beta-helix repeat protein